MQWSFFRIPVTGGEEAEGLNRFLRSVRVLNVHREFVGQGDASYWAVAVECLPGVAGAQQGRDASAAAAARVDFKAILSPEDFALFARLREWRKEEGARDGVPVYTIFTNEQLAEIARRRPASSAALAQIDGIGKGRIEKYGVAALDIIRGSAHGEGERALPENS
jgi:superfamily II DNA helicase RecQ